MNIILPQKVLHLYDEEKKKNPKLNGLYLISEKIDGWYVYIDFFVKTGWDNLRSRKGRIIPSLELFKHEFEKLETPKENCRFIAEAIIPSLDFYTMNGLFNRTKGDYHLKDVEFFLHDYISLDDYFIRTEKNQAIERYKRLQSLDLKSSKHIFHHQIMGIAEYSKIWNAYFHKAIDNGKEGIVLKRETGIYAPDKRNSDLLKMKLEKTFDLKIVNFFKTIGEKGNDSYQITVERENGVKLDVRVGKFSDIEEFKQNSPIGKYAEIQTMCELENGMLREPRFKCLRYDKI